MKRTAHHFILIVLCLVLNGLIAVSAVAQPQNQDGTASASPANLQSPTQPAAAPSQTEGSAVPDLGFSVLRTAGGLGVVLCLIAGGYFAARKFAPRYFAKAASSQNMKIIETLPMGDRRSISLIEVGDNRFLVGNTPQQINLLMALSDSESLVSQGEATRPMPRSAPPKEPGLQFRKMYDFEKGRPAQRGINPLPEDLRVKMRQLRRALEK